MGRRLAAIIVALIVGVAGAAVFAGVAVFNANGGLVGLLDSASPVGRWPNNDGSNFAAARAEFKTKLTLTSDDTAPAPSPPAIFRKVTYRSAVGPLTAYLTSDPKDGQKHPAIVWITGGDCNALGEMWEPADPKNDQTAAAFRKAGLILMAPSLRGGNNNPGARQGFAGEIDDVVAAADFLAQQPYVDPTRIYLGGHSTGGTLALLTAEASSRFRATFAFGPVHRAEYHQQFEDIDFDKLDRRERLLRAPEYWLASAKRPVFVLEGTESPGNIGPLKRMREMSHNPNIHFLAVQGATHFTILAPITAVVADKIVHDTRPSSDIQLTEADLFGEYVRFASRAGR
jgi:pimeloyl-ACP methyl ester carboxylesterase